MPNGNGLIAGGDNVDLMAPFLTNGFFSIRIFNPFGPSYSLGPNMPTGRWYPTLATLADGTILIMGGSQVSGLMLRTAVINTGARGSCIVIFSWLQGTMRSPADIRGHAHAHACLLCIWPQAM